MTAHRIKQVTKAGFLLYLRTNSDTYIRWTKNKTEAVVFDNLERANLIIAAARKLNIKATLEVADG